MSKSIFAYGLLEALDTQRGLIWLKLLELESLTVVGGIEGALLLAIWFYML